MKRFISALGIAAMVAAVVLIAAPAMADCSTGTKFGGNNGYNIGGAGTAYLTLPGSAGPGAFNVRWWQTDQPANNEGTETITNWINNPYPPYSTAADWTFFNDLDGAGTTNCIATCVTLYIEDTSTGLFSMWTVAENAGPNAMEWDFTGINGLPYGPTPTGASPRARVTSSGRTTATDLGINYDVPDVSGGARSIFNCNGATGAVTGRQTYIQQSATMPSTNIAGWAPLGAAAAGDGPADARNQVFDCTDTAQDWWIAVGLEVDGNPARFVSQPVQIECDPNLADPNGAGSFKRIERQGNPRTRDRN